jgi:hypothetical protein
MINEFFRGSGIEQGFSRPVFDEPRGLLPRYDESDFAMDDMRQLAIVRDELGEIAVVPMVNIIVPAQQVQEARQEPKTMGEAFFDLLLGFIGLALIKSGDFLESLGEKK